MTGFVVLIGLIGHFYAAAPYRESKVPPMSESERRVLDWPIECFQGQTETGASLFL